MFRWIAHNKEWLFSGAGVAFFIAVWGLLKAGYGRWKQRRDVVDPTSRSHPVKYERMMSKGLIERLPAFLLRVLIKPSEIASRVSVDLRGNTPIALGLNDQVPHINMYFDITNLSGFDLVLDRMIVEVWFGQPTFTTAILKRYLIPGGEITRDIYLRQPLTAEQRNQIQSFEQSEQSRGYIYVQLTAYFESTLGRIEVAKNIERAKV
jgi:hypothetical protein